MSGYNDRTKFFYDDGEEMKKIEIKEGGRTIGMVCVGQALSEVVPLLDGYPAVYVVHDMNVRDKAADLVSVLSGSGVNVCGLMSVEAAEENKNMDTVMRICRWLMESGAERSALLLAVGGGITTDMAGFAASVYKRGIRFAYIPTTLLAQVDAAIGGKTGVNLDSYKNMIGVIRQPQFTWLYPEVLTTLTRRDFLSGAAEMLKTFIISGGDCYRECVDFLGSLNLVPGIAADSKDGFESFLRLNQGRLSDLICAAAAVKAAIVSEDQFETGLRRRLNLGHTFAHAIEWYERAGGTDCALSHGEAVAVGTVLAARLSEASGVSGHGLADRIADNFARCGLPTACPFGFDDLEDAMNKDKKAENGKIHFILIRNIGETIEYDMTAAEAVALLKGAI